MNVYQKQLSLEFDDLVDAANAKIYNVDGHNVEETYPIGKVKRRFPADVAAMSVTELNRIMQNELAACCRLNSLFKGIFDEVLHRCAPLGIEYLGYRMVDTQLIPQDGCPLTLEMTFSPQKCLGDQRSDIGITIENVKRTIIEVCDEVNVAYSGIVSVLDVQKTSKESHPVTVISKGEDFEGIGDYIEVRSENIAKYVEKSLREMSLVQGSALLIDGYPLVIEPPEILFEVMADDPVPERRIYEAKDVYIRSAFGEANGEYYMKIDGAVVDRTAKAVEIQLDSNRVFTDRMKNDAGRVNVKHLYQFNEKVLDFTYLRFKNRVTRPRLESKHEMLLSIENFRKVHEIRQFQMKGPATSLDKIVAERSGLI